MSDKNYWWNKAKEASQQIGWFPTVILAQWQWETANFTSNNLNTNNNIAGQTWTPQYPESMRGSARPSAEGGYYVRFDDPVAGYVDFIQRNPRYNNVQLQQTEEDQIRTIATDGWAADLSYADHLIETLNANKQQGYILEVDYMISKEDARQIRAILSKYWNEMQGNPEIQDYTHHLVCEVYKAAGMDADKDE